MILITLKTRIHNMQKPIPQLIQEMITTLTGTEVEVVEQKDPEMELVVYSITLDDPHMVIGRRGETLKSLNHIVRKIVEEQTDEGYPYPVFFIDVNGYYSKRIDELKMRANIVAERVKSFKKEIELEPMSSYERFLMHTYLGGVEGISTYSSGSGRERRLVVTQKQQDTSPTE